MPEGLKVTRKYKRRRAKLFTAKAAEARKRAKEYYWANRDKRLAYQKDYYNKHADKIQKYQTEWARKNRSWRKPILALQGRMRRVMNKPKCLVETCDNKIEVGQQLYCKRCAPEQHSYRVRKAA